MRTIKLGSRDVKLVGSPMTPFFYKQAFGQSMTGDLMAMSDIDKDGSKFDDINILQMVWALEKTARTGKIEAFEEWLSEFEYIDLSDVVEEVMDEVTRATFRGQKIQQATAK